MDINEYFSNTDSANAKLSSSLPQGPLYSKTIKNFYEDLIGPRLDEIDANILKEWNEMLERYINLATPIYWIRKYESGPQNPTNDKQDNRRGALTLVVDDNYKIKFAYAFISNYDAQEIYSMIRAGVTPPTEAEFAQMMLSGSYQLHYDPRGGDCQDDQVTYYEHRGSVQSGVLNQQNWYLAHLHDVNGISYDNSYSLSNKDIEEIFLSRGHVADWTDVSSLPTVIQSFLNSSRTSEGLTRKVRIIKISEVYDSFNKKVSDSVDEKDIDKLFKQILQASFYRFIHPCNYFLVPARKNECDFVYGRKQISIGEYKPLVEHVKNQIENKFKSHINFTDFLSKLMLPSSTVSIKSGSIDIHVCYGTKYSDFCLQDKCDTVNYPSGYTDVQAFLDYYNASGKNIHLTIDYSIDGILNCFQIKHKNVSEKYIYDKIKNGKKIIEWIKLDTIDIGPASPKTISKRKTSGTSTAPTSSKSSTPITTTILPVPAPPTSGIKTIGQEMKAFFSNLLLTGKLNAAMIDNLRDPNYCSVNLGTSYPIIVDITTDSFDSGRYYTDIYLGTYRICSQWQKKKANDYRDQSMNWASKL